MYLERGPAHTGVGEKWAEDLKWSRTVFLKICSQITGCLLKIQVVRPLQPLK